MNIDPASIPDAWPVRGDFTLPNWALIDEWVDSHFEEAQYDEVYRELCRFWFGKLRDQLGGKYYLMESDKWLLLTMQDERTATTAIRALEETTARILNEWDGVASDAGYGQHAAILFEEADDYYDYMGQYFPDLPVEFAATSGVMLDQGYSHIAVGEPDLASCIPTLFHELTHMLVGHLPLPLWINEGLATSNERVLSGNTTPLLNDSLVQEHRAYWNGHTIQQFWNGDSFNMPGQPQKLSYNLAEVLATQLKELEGYRDFILNATWEDAGEASAREHLGMGVGDIVSVFLGPGAWGVNWALPQDEVFR